MCIWAPGTHHSMMLVRLICTVQNQRTGSGKGDAMVGELMEG